MPAAAKGNFIQGHEYDLGDGSTAVWGGKAGWVSPEQYLAQKGQGQQAFEDQVALVRRLDKAKQMASKWDATGFLGKLEAGNGPSAIWKGIPGTAGYNLDQELLPVRANAFVNNLTQMRQNSPTGGAVGNVSEPEGEKLGSLAGSLNVGQSRDQLLDEVGNTRAAMARHQPGLTRDNPIDRTQVDPAQIPEGAYWRDAYGRVFQQHKGAGYTAPNAQPAAPPRAAPADPYAGWSAVKH